MKKRRGANEQSADVLGGLYIHHHIYVGIHHRLRTGSAVPQYKNAGYEE
jgi:hypothetical protein